VRRFCAVEGWEEKAKRARRKGGDHYAYTKPLLDGSVLYVQVSRGSGGYQDPDLVRFIFREELKVTPEEFWRAVDDGVPPNRGQEGTTSPSAAGEPVPLDLLRNLTTKAGYSVDAVLDMGKKDAVAAWATFLTQGGEQT
jgi:hypothetical protein